MMITKTTVDNAIIISLIIISHSRAMARESDHHQVKPKTRDPTCSCSVQALSTEFAVRLWSLCY